MLQNIYESVRDRRMEILRASTGIDFARLRQSPIAFDYDGLLAEVGLDIFDIQQMQRSIGVGLTPLLELKNLTQLVRRLAGPGKGARIFLKDEACNPAGSCKDRSAAISALWARQRGFGGLVASSTGNYGVALAAQQGVNGPKAVIVQEAFDGTGRSHPMVMEKARKCEALGAEVIQTSVGPEKSYLILALLENTGYFLASLNTPWAIRGMETLGLEIAQQVREQTGRDPSAVVVTHASGGQVTGTGLGLRRAGAYRTRVIGSCVDLAGLDNASSTDFGHKLFTTGHSGHAMATTTLLHDLDVPLSASRPLRYLDRSVMVTEGEVLYATEALAHLEGLERGPGANICLTSALVLAQEMDRDQVLVVSETEYAGQTNTPAALIAYAQESGIEVKSGHPRDSRPGNSVVIPEHPYQLSVRPIALEYLRRSHIRKILSQAGQYVPDQRDAEFLAQDTNTRVDWVRRVLSRVRVPN